MVKGANYWNLLQGKEFRALWIAQVFSQLSINTLVFVLALRLYQTTTSNTAVSGLFLAYGIPAVFFGMIAGAAADHVDKRRVLIYCDLLRAVLVLSLIFFSDNLILVYVVTFVNSMITQFYFPSEAPLIPKFVSSGLLVSANSLFTLTFFSSLAIGSVVAGPLLRIFGPQWIFVVLSCCFVVAAYAQSHLPSLAKGALGFRTILSFDVQHIMNRMWTSLSEGFAYVKATPQLASSIMLLTGTQIIFALLAVLGPGYADRVLGIDIHDASFYIVGPAIIGIVVGTIWVGNFGSHLGTTRLIRMGIYIAGITLMLLALPVHKLLAICLFFILGFANSLLDGPANTLLQKAARGQMRGRVYGILTSAIGGIGVLPILVGGIAADILGVQYVLVVLGALIVLFGIYRLKYTKV